MNDKLCNKLKALEETAKLSVDNTITLTQSDVSDIINLVEMDITSLQETIPLMLDFDYKNRFVAEYYQTKIRYNKLHNMIVKCEAGTLDFTPNCPIDVLKAQANAMGQYLYQLEVRAQIEKINLEE